MAARQMKDGKQLNSASARTGLWTSCGSLKPGCNRVMFSLQDQPVAQLGFFVADIPGCDGSVSSVDHKPGLRCAARRLVPVPGPPRPSPNPGWSPTRVITRFEDASTPRPGRGPTHPRPGSGPDPGHNPVWGPTHPGPGSAQPGSRPNPPPTQVGPRSGLGVLASSNRVMSRVGPRPGLGVGCLLVCYSSIISVL